MPKILVPMDSNEQIDCGILSRGEVYFMGADDNQFVTLDEFTATFHGPDGDFDKTNILIVQQVPGGAAAAAVTHLGRGGSMRVYINKVHIEPDQGWLMSTYQGFRFYGLGT